MSDEWQTLAACKNKHDIMFSATKEHQALELCDKCTVIDECVEYALSIYDTLVDKEFIIGGMEPIELRAVYVRTYGGRHVVSCRGTGCDNQLNNTDIVKYKSLCTNCRDDDIGTIFRI